MAYLSPTRILNPKPWNNFNHVPTVAARAVVVQGHGEGHPGWAQQEAVVDEEAAGGNPKPLNPKPLNPKP